MAKETTHRKLVTPTEQLAKMAKGSGIPRPMSTKSGTSKAGAMTSPDTSRMGGKSLVTMMKEEFDYIFLIVIMLDPKDPLMIALEQL